MRRGTVHYRCHRRHRNRLTVATAASTTLTSSFNVAPMQTAILPQQTFHRRIACRNCRHFLGRMVFRKINGVSYHRWHCSNLECPTVRHLWRRRRNNNNDDDNDD